MEERDIVEQKTIETLEEMKHILENGSEFWLAREIQSVLGYTEWRNFVLAIKRAKESCATFGGSVENHFVDHTKKVSTGSGANRTVQDIVLSRYACQLIAMNGDPTKPEIAGAQAYFAVQTRRQELFDQLSEDEKRLIQRDRVKDANRHLAGAANEAGVKNWGLFQDAGYRGLYGELGLNQIKAKKSIDNKEDLLDCVSRMELAENEFRITQTEAKLNRTKVKGDVVARETHYEVAKVIRNTIEEIGGAKPEDLPREPSIKKLKVNKPLDELPPGTE